MIDPAYSRVVSSLSEVLDFAAAAGVVLPSDLSHFLVEERVTYLDLVRFFAFCDLTDQEPTLELARSVRERSGT